MTPRHVLGAPRGSSSTARRPSHCSITSIRSPPGPSVAGSQVVPSRLKNASPPTPELTSTPSASGQARPQPPMLLPRTAAGCSCQATPSVELHTPVCPLILPPMATYAASEPTSCPMFRLVSWSAPQGVHASPSSDWNTTWVDCQGPCPSRETQMTAIQPTGPCATPTMYPPVRRGRLAGAQSAPSLDAYRATAPLASFPQATNPSAPAAIPWRSALPGHDDSGKRSTSVSSDASIHPCGDGSSIISQPSGACSS